MNERVDVERVNAENKVESLKIALELRIRQHRSSLKLAQERIDACNYLLTRAPSQKDVLDGVIHIWTRIRNHHAAVVATSEETLRSLP